MSDDEKVVQAVFYASETGTEPVWEWLKNELSEAQRKLVGKHIQTVEYGWPMGMPIVRKLDAQLWEVRARLDGGIARVFFTVEGRDMILLHGFVKKSQKTPRHELDTALRRLSSLRKP